MTTFVSYAREDYDAAQRLTADLRTAGIDVWIDQRNIRAGEKWDTAVETALNQSPSMLVILSPDSVQSQAVMDEVSYALDEGKCVVPVIHRDCRIPMRMRRLQYVDLTQSYDDGVVRVVEALRNPEPGIVVVRPKRRGWRPPVVAAAIGLVYGAGMSFALYRHYLQLENRAIVLLQMMLTGALIAAALGAIVGAITGTRKRCIVAAVIGGVLSAAAWIGTAHGVSTDVYWMAAVIGGPGGAIIAATFARMFR